MNQKRQKQNINNNTRFCGNALVYKCVIYLIGNTFSKFYFTLHKILK